MLGSDACPPPSGLGVFFVDPCELPPGPYGLVQLAFLLAVYAVALFFSSKLISDGAELLLLVLSPGLVGGLILPLLGAVPDGAIVLFSGLGPKEQVQEQLSVGVGALAGSTVFGVTIPWALCAWLGRVDLAPGGSRANFRAGLTRAHSSYAQQLFTTGIQTSSAVRPAAAIMFLSSLPYLVIQVPASVFNNQGSGGSDPDALAAREQWYALAGVLLSLSACVGYSIYSVTSAGAVARQEAEIFRARRSAVARRVLDVATLLQLEHEAAASVAAADGGSAGGESGDLAQLEAIADGGTGGGATPGSASSAVIRSLFERFDTDGSGKLDRGEVKAMLKALRVHSFHGHGHHGTLVSVLDHSPHKDGITLDEFEDIVKRLCAHARKEKEELESSAAAAAAAAAPPRSRRVRVWGVRRSSDGGDASEAPGSPLLLNSEGDESDSDSDDGEDNEEAEVEVQLTPWQIKRNATGMLLCGVLLVTLFADPMVDILSEVGTRTGVPAFYVSFIITPAITCMSEVFYSAVQSAKKSRAGLESSFLQLLGATTMNNTFTLCVFLAIIYVRQLVWAFSAETLAIIATQAGVAVIVLTSRNNVEPLWKALLVGALYPIAIGSVVLLEQVAKWN